MINREIISIRAEFEANKANVVEMLLKQIT